MAKNNTSGRTIVVIPFHLNDENDSIKLIQQIDNVRSDCGKKIDSSIYHDHIEKYFNWDQRNNIDLINNQNSFLHFYDLDYSKFDKENTYKDQLFEIRSKGGDEQLHQFHFEFGHVHIVLNKKPTYNEIKLGYVLIDFNWICEKQVSLSEFCEIEFFRYHKINDPDKKYSFYNVISGQELNIHTLLVSTKIEVLLDKNCTNFPNRKPFLFHIVNSETDPNEIYSYYAYRSIRIPGKNKDAYEFDDKFKKMISSIMHEGQLGVNTHFYSLSEGTLLLCPRQEGLNSIQNKYFPAFILALNQREIQYYISSQFGDLEINNTNFKYNPKQLRRIQGTFVKIRFDQFFTSVSINTEVNSFFRYLRDVMKVKEILLENEEKIDALKNLVENAQSKEERESDKKMNFLLIAITLLSLFSAFNDAYDLFSVKDQFSPNLVWLPVLFMTVFVFYVNKRKN